VNHDERVALFEESRRYLGDVQLDPNSTEGDVKRATDAANRAYKALRGTGTLLGIRRSA
jgi:hypothetical protein